MQMMVTGPRPDKLGWEYHMSGPYSQALIWRFKLILGHYKPVLGISGGALGVDLIFAFACLEMGIKVLLAIPFEGHGDTWAQESVAYYKLIAENPLTTTYVVTAGPYANWKYQVRNEWMVDKLKTGDYATVVWDGSPGGTANCVKYLEQKVNSEYIIKLDPKTVKQEYIKMLAGDKGVASETLASDKSS